MVLITLFLSAFLATIPDPDYGSASAPGGSIMIVPDGSGPTLADRGTPITCQVLDLAGDPVAGYPFQDIWVAFDDPGQGAICNNGSVADASTDANGMTTISGAIAGGGNTRQGLRVAFAGVPIPNGWLDIQVNSPDYDADLNVSLTDVGILASDYSNGVYDFRSDFNHNGTEDLEDVALFAAANGASCP